MTPPDETRDASLASRWSALHHGIDSAGVPLLRRWLRLMWAGARVVARTGVPPTAITVTGVLIAGAAVAAARPAPAVAAPLVLLAVLCDGLDGAVAVVADRATRSGRIADAIADRLCDLAFAAVLWRCGAPGWSAVLAGVLAVGVDTLRRVRRVPATITVAERPTFTVCAILACVSAAATSAHWPAANCAAVWIVACCVGVVQLLLARPGGQPGAAPVTPPRASGG